MENLIRWLLNRVLRRGTDMALRKGSDMAFGAPKPKQQMTREERRQAKAGKDAQKRMRQALKIGRKLW